MSSVTSSDEEGHGGQGQSWVTMGIRCNFMKRIESTLEQYGDYLATIYDPCMRPAQLEIAVLQYTLSEGGERDMYRVEGERLLRLIREGQALDITKDEELVSVYWDPAALSRGHESPPRLEFRIEDELIGPDNAAGRAVPVHNPNWRDGKNLDEIMEYILEHDEGTHKDVTFYVGPRRVRISAHRQFLALVSIVFDYALYESPGMEAVGPQDHSYVVILNASPHAFKMLLKYVYCRKVNWSTALDRVTEAMCLLQLAQQFQMRDLAERCVGQIQEHISEENAPAVLKNSRVLHHANLAKFTADFIAANGRRILYGAEFKRLSRDCVSMILEKDELNMAELSVLNAVIQWAEHRIRSRSENPDVKVTGEGIRAELGPVLYLIRFPLLDREVFGRHVLKDHRGLLSDHDELAIHRFEIGVNPDAIPFSAIPRIHDCPSTRVQSAAAPTNENGSDSGCGNSTPIAPQSSSPVSTIKVSPIPTSTAAVDEQLEIVTEEQFVEATSQPSIDIPPEDNEEVEEEDDIVDFMDIEEEMQALFQNDDNTLGRDIGIGRPPRKVMRHDSEQVGTNPSRNHCASGQQRLEYSDAEASISTLVMDGPFQPPATPSTSSASSESTSKRPLRTKKAPQRWEYDDSEKRTSPRKRLSSTSPSGTHEDSANEGGAVILELEQSVTEPFLNEIQQEYIAQYGEEYCENNLTSLYQTIAAMMDDPSSQQMMDALRRDDEPIVINKEYLTENGLTLPPLYFPSLLEFHVKYLCPIDSASNLKKYLNKLLPQNSLLFFNKTEEYGQNLLSTLWISDINVDLEINGLKVLKIDHRSESLTLSRISAASPPLLQGLNFDSDVKQLQLEEIPVDSALLPKSELELLTLRNVRGFWRRTSAFIRECRNLRELSIDNMGRETIDLVRDFKLFGDKGHQRIRKIAIGNANLDCSNEIQEPLEHSPVHELYLDGCTWTMNFLKSMSFAFSCLRKCKLGTSANLYMIRDLLEIQSLQWLGVWELEFIVFETPTTKRKRTGEVLPPLEYLQAKAKIKEVLSQAGLGDDAAWLNDKKKTFVLEKLMYDGQQEGRWIGTKYEDEIMAKEVFSQLSYDQFGWSAFYSDYHLFNKMK